MTLSDLSTVIKKRKCQKTPNSVNSVLLCTSTVLICFYLIIYINTYDVIFRWTI